MKLKSLFAASTVAFASTIGSLVFPAAAQAASQNECAIWLCAPTGFAYSGCGGAKSAMHKRVLQGKPPFPSYSSCAVEDDSMSGKHGIAAYHPAWDECIDWQVGGGDVEECAEYKHHPARWEKDKACTKLEREAQIPGGCTRQGRYVEFFVHGVKEGDTYYW